MDFIVFLAVFLSIKYFTFYTNLNVKRLVYVLLIIRLLLLLLLLDQLKYSDLSISLISITRFDILQITFLEVNSVDRLLRWNITCSSSICILHSTFRRRSCWCLISISHIDDILLVYLLVLKK